MSLYLQTCSPPPFILHWSLSLWYNAHPTTKRYISRSRSRSSHHRIITRLPRKQTGNPVTSLVMARRQHERSVRRKSRDYFHKVDLSTPRARPSNMIHRDSPPAWTFFSFFFFSIRVLQTVTLPLLRRNYHILRFNSRGVGRSTGWSSFTGTNEGMDLRALVQWGLDNVLDVHSVVIVVRLYYLLSNHES